MILLEDRSVLAVGGVDKFSFLQGLITNDIKHLENINNNVIYTAMLTPQGKIRFDFFLFIQDGNLFIDAPIDQAENIQKTLKLYKLRADVTITPRQDLCVTASFEGNKNMLEDPRLPNMGFRSITSRESLIGKQMHPTIFYHTKRIEFGVPDSTDFIEDRAFIAEYGLDYLNGVSFTKGCYVGQEIVARTKHKGTVHKVLHKVTTADGAQLPEAGTEIICNEKTIGQIRSSVENAGLAIIRRDKLSSEANITANGINLTDVIIPEWFKL